MKLLSLAAGALALALTSYQQVYAADPCFTVEYATETMAANGYEVIGVLPPMGMERLCSTAMRAAWSGLLLSWTTACPQWGLSCRTSLSRSGPEPTGVSGVRA